MKFSHYLLAGILSSCVSFANANEVCQTLPGMMSCGKGSANNVSANGMLNVDGSELSGKTTVNGTLSAEKAKFSLLDVNGSANINNCTVNELAKIKGALVASSTIFNDDISLYSDTIKLNQCTVNGDVHVFHTQSESQTIYLSDNTHLKGDITFDDGKGKVILQGNSTVSGEVMGGEVINK